MDLKEQASFSIIWIVFGSLFSTMLRFLIKIILARILVPTDFGIFAIILLFINCLMLFSNLGLTNALIHKKKEFERAANTAFYIAILMGFILFVTAYTVSPYVALFFEKPDIIPMIKIFSFTLLFLGIEIIPDAILVKRLEFGRKIFVESISVITFFLISLALVYSNRGVWSLIFGQFFSMFLSAFGMLIISGFKPRCDFSYSLSKELLGYGKHIIAAGILGFLITQGDSFFIGKMLGTLALGYYVMAYTIANLPTKMISFVVSSLSFPIFAKLQDDEKRLKNAYLNILDLSFFMIIPISLGIFAIAPEFVKIVLGPKWLQIISVLRILCFATLFRCYHHVGGYFFQAIGNPKLHRDITLFELVGMALLIYPLSYFYNIAGTAIAVTLPIMFGGTYLFFRVRDKLNINDKKDLRILFLEFYSALIMIAVVFMLKNKLFINVQFPELVILVISGAVFYLILLVIFAPTIFLELGGIIKTIFSKSEQKN